jgi:hypothetical protein
VNVGAAVPRPSCKSWLSWCSRQHHQLL